MNGSMQTDIEALAADWLPRRDGPAWSHADQNALDAWLDDVRDHSQLTRRATENAIDDHHGWLTRQFDDGVSAEQATRLLERKIQETT